MKFWDSSAVLPLILEELSSPLTEDILSQDSDMIVWWGTSVESNSAIQRRFREGTLPVDQLQNARESLRGLLSRAAEIVPSEVVRSLSHRLLAVHPLRAADSLQLSAALVWAEQNPGGHEMVCLDERLRQAARQEGFVVLPAT